MTGGSALRLCHGLTRPSFDLDLDVSERRNWLALVRRAVDEDEARRLIAAHDLQFGQSASVFEKELDRLSD